MAENEIVHKEAAGEPGTDVGRLFQRAVLRLTIANNSEELGGFAEFISRLPSLAADFEHLRPRAEAGGREGRLAAEAVASWDQTRKAIAAAIGAKVPSDDDALDPRDLARYAVPAVDRRGIVLPEGPLFIIPFDDIASQVFGDEADAKRAALSVPEGDDAEDESE